MAKYREENLIIKGAMANEAIVYLTECVLSTVVGEYWKHPSERTMSRGELLRQVSIADFGIEYIRKNSVVPTKDLYDSDLLIGEVLKHPEALKKFLQNRFMENEKTPFAVRYKPLF